MPLASTDLKFRPSALQSDTVPAQNGGRMTYGEVVSGVKNNLFSDVTVAQRSSGATRYRKMFLHLDSNTTTAMNNAKVFMDKLTAADDYLLFQSATATGTESSDKNEALLFGIGALASNVSAGVSSITVACEHADYATLTPFRVGMTIRVSNIPVGSGTGTEEFVPLSAVSYSGATATLTFTGYPLANAYLASNTLVSSVMSVSTVAGAFDTPVVTSTAGTLAHGTAGYVTVPSKGSINDTWTLTFSSATSFSVAGAVTGALSGTGTIGSDYSANNQPVGTPYFSILAVAWGGTFVSGDTVTFNTTQASLPMLIRQRIPAASGTLTGTVAGFAFRGESA